MIYAYYKAEGIIEFVKICFNIDKANKDHDKITRYYKIEQIIRLTDYELRIIFYNFYSGDQYFTTSLGPFAFTLYSEE